MECPSDCVPRLLTVLEGEDGGAGDDGLRPSSDHLRDLLDGAFAGSLQPEEGRFSRFALAFVPRDKATKGVRADAFAKDKPFTPQTIGKLAPALDPGRTFIAVHINSNGELSIWGLLHTLRAQDLAAPETQLNGFLPVHAFLIVRAHGPGVFLVYFSQRLQLVFARGQSHWGPTAGRLQGALRGRAGLDGNDAEVISQIVSRMVTLHKGGTLLITDPEIPVDTALLDLSYLFSTSSRMLRVAAQESVSSDGGRDKEAALRSACDYVAQLSAIDGAVHLQSDLEIKGFGGKIMKTVPGDVKLLAEDANVGFDATPQTARPLDWSEIPGMRHRSAALFCAQQPGQALAIVVSQDGDTTLFGRQNDGVVRRIGPYALGVALSVE